MRVAPERIDPPLEADERTTLTAFLDFQRATLATASVPEAFSTWRAECEHSRALVAAAPSLDVSGNRGGGRFSLRWVLAHMIEEYARHNGHADLLRERLDGSTGD
jgi:Protein of unknown function (DUF664)